MSEDTEYLRRVYPENFPSPTLIDWVMAVLVFSLIFLTVRLHLQKKISFVNNVLNIQIFKPRNKEHA
ncbi:MAG: hypothetical protein J5U17_07765 [Candidatus Methanoperedens sp.]|nr:hypothetical protein [Candidatus Methanoperedens sp.]MCE8425657.1 hypothetical protein [Candidatus Methanoperedens sp.]MCE8428486.1 hypothetical protein [Candidatus Methanoperedens sp.]